jgi:hypothetical protein
MDILEGPRRPQRLKLLRNNLANLSETPEIYKGVLPLRIGAGGWGGDV